VPHLFEWTNKEIIYKQISKPWLVLVFLVACCPAAATAAWCAGIWTTLVLTDRRVPLGRIDRSRTTKVSLRPHRVDSIAYHTRHGFLRHWNYSFVRQLGRLELVYGWCGSSGEESYWRSWWCVCIAGHQTVHWLGCSRIHRHPSRSEMNHLGDIAASIISSSYHIIRICQGAPVRSSEAPY